MKPIIALVILGLSSTALADTEVTVQPKTAQPGAAVLVTVTGAKELPKGEASGKPLQFFRAKAGFQAVFAIPLDAKTDDVAIAVAGAKVARVAITTKTFPETSLVVEDEMANPPAAERIRIDADNKAIIGALAKGDGDPQFTTAFRRPRGEVTSSFGEWRTFNDGHRSQHLGLDVFATEGSKVRAVNAGTVTLVRETFLAGNVVVIAHGSGIASAYFHLSASNVAEGDLVEPGEVIGAAGQTGRTTGPHLHVSIRVAGGFVDPARFFRLPIAPRAAATARR